MQSTRSSSPFTNAQAEQWYANSPTYQEPGSPINASAGVGWRDTNSPTLPRTFSNDDAALETPLNSRFLDIDRMTPDTEARLMSSARTDRNTPSLARHRYENTTGSEQGEEAADDSSIVHQAQQQYEDHPPRDEPDASDQDTEQIAENDEEQIYLNEVLEESLREAEVEPEVPAIPGAFLGGANQSAYMSPEAERHEDRLDAFDYENMFLHSAMGTYTGKSLNGSDSGSNGDSEEDDDDTSSVETSRADARTPVDDSEPLAVHQGDMSRKGFEANMRSSPPTDISMVSSPLLGSPPKIVMPETPNAWSHARSKSMESVSTSATFETATEGQYERENETFNEIFTWNPMPSSSLGYSPTSYQAYRTGSSKNSPVQLKHGFSSPQAGGRSTPLAPHSPITSSPLRQDQYRQYVPLVESQKLLASPGLGIGIVGAENAQYIDDSGIPQRFRGKPSPTHSRESSNNTNEVLAQANLRPESSATVIAASPAQSRSIQHERQQSSGASSAVSRVHASSPLTPSRAHRRTPSGSALSESPVVVTITNSPQRKVVINRALQYPELNMMEPQLSLAGGPPNVPLPVPPTTRMASSAALQAQMASPKKIDIKSSKHGHKRSLSTGIHKRAHPLPTTATQYSTSPSIKAPSAPIPSSTSVRKDSLPLELSAPVPNLEVLMESLIKLVDPSFSLAPGIRFDEIDKNLVLNLLRGVGGVCNSILTAGIQSGSPALGRSQADEMMRLLRARLAGAADVLEGRDEVLDRERKAFGEFEIGGLKGREI